MELGSFEAARHLRGPQKVCNNACAICAFRLVFQPNFTAMALRWTGPQNFCLDFGHMSQFGLRLRLAPYRNQICPNLHFGCNFNELLHLVRPRAV